MLIVMNPLPLTSARPLTPTGVDAALRAAWSADTCSPDDAARTPWTPDNPAWGHCDITALVVHDLFGGVLLVGEVWSADGEQQGFHWWNRLASGVELDLTREQFLLDQRITEPRSVERPPGRLPRRHEEYELLRQRFTEAIPLAPVTPAAPGGWTP
ncbi:YunG family protein [Streptomyces sp. NPDC055243]|uniref:YunG family protein n=1 Tax=Streptomyces sp. NPDC055243 TaxID=3365720 RepID=UPI0037D7FC7B